MAIIKRYLGKHPETGEDYYNFSSDSDSPHFVVTGKAAAGLVQLGDGTLYDVTDEVIEAASAQHAKEISHHIGLQHMKRGTPGVQYEGKDA